MNYTVMKTIVKAATLKGCQRSHEPQINKASTMTSIDKEVSDHHK